MNRQLRPYQGLLLFAVILLSVILIGSLLQLKFGVWGVGMNELLMLGITLAAAAVCRADFRAVFSVKPPPLRSFFGSLIVYAGTYCAVIPVSLLTERFFPSDLDAVNDVINALGTGVSPAVALIAMAVLPAICEEALHRGFILNSLKPIKNEAAIVLCAGIIFGVFHLDAVRLIPTGMLGACFAFMALRSKSMLIPMIFHFGNNALAVAQMFMPAEETATVPMTGLQLAAITMLCVGLSLILLYIGGRVMSPEKRPRDMVSMIVFTAGVPLLLGGIAITLLV